MPVFWELLVQQPIPYNNQIMLCSEDSIFDINITPCVDGRKGKTFIMEYVQILCFYLFKKTNIANYD